MSITLVGVRPDGCGPHGRFSRTDLTRLTRDVHRRKMLRPVNIHPVISASHFRVVFKRHECHTTLVTRLARVPTIVLRISSRATTRVTIARGLRHGSIAPVRRTGTCRGLVRDNHCSIRSLTIRFNGGRGCVHAHLGFMSLVPRVTRLLRGSRVAVDMTDRVYQCNASVRGRICCGRLGSDSDVLCSY